MEEHTEAGTPQIVEIVPEDLKRPTYANAFRTLYTPYELELIFAHVSALNSTREGEFEARVAARVAVPPVLAKRMLETLRQAIEQYEADFGELKGVDDDLHNRIQGDKE